jgi:hypothetical protein
LETTRLEDNTLRDSDRQPTYEAIPASTPPVVETPDQELVVARQTPVEAAPEWVAQTPPNRVEVPAERAPAEGQPLRKQEWL